MSMEIQSGAAEIKQGMALFNWLQEKSSVRGSEELAQWTKLFEQFNYAPREFYKLVEKNLESRQIPGARVELRILPEGGILSPERLYFMIRRERLVFLLCAAPFGKGFFVSSRLIDYRASVGWLDYLVVGGLLGGLSFGVGVKFGLGPGLFALGLFGSLLWSLFRHATGPGAGRLEDMLTGIPCLGPLYEHYFRPDTYFRRDAAEMFRQTVHNAVMQSIDEMTTAQGVRGLTNEERTPVLRNLYRK